jgi:hypothetical protein
VVVRRDPAYRPSTRVDTESNKDFRSALAPARIDSPGARFIKHHHRRKKKDERPGMFSQLPDAYIEEAMTKPCVSRCARCGWRARGTAAEVIQQFREHQPDCIADTELVTVPL